MNVIIIQAKIIIIFVFLVVHLLPISILLVSTLILVFVNTTVYFLI